jgi:predicted permease
MEILTQLLFDLIGAIFGWAAFTTLMLSVHKDENESTWNWGQYKKENWDNWLRSLVFVPVLIWIGYAGLDLESVGLEFKWSNLYFLCSGFAPEIAIKLWKKVKN